MVRDVCTAEICILVKIGVSRILYQDLYGEIREEVAVFLSREISFVARVQQHTNSNAQQRSAALAFVGGPLLTLSSVQEL